MSNRIDSLPDKYLRWIKPAGMVPYVGGAGLLSYGGGTLSLPPPTVSGDIVAGGFEISTGITFGSGELTTDRYLD